MNELVFVDSNILIYSQDADAGDKRERAIESLKPLWTAGTGRVSVQVLQEFYVNATRKLTNPVSLATAREVIHVYGEWVKAQTSVATVMRASELAELAQLSFWDGLIIASAEQAGATCLYSEDLNPGQTIAGIKIIDPLAASFIQPA